MRVWGGCPTPSGSMNRVDSKIIEVSFWRIKSCCYHSSLVVDSNIPLFTLLSSISLCYIHKTVRVLGLDARILVKVLLGQI